MLTINPSELIWTVLGFLALYFLLKRFLYAPLVRFMDERAARVQAGLDERRGMDAALEENARRLDERHEQVERESRGLLDERRRADEQRRAESVQQARQRAAETEEAARQSAEERLGAVLRRSVRRHLLDEQRNRDHKKKFDFGVAYTRSR